MLTQNDDDGGGQKEYFIFFQFNSMMTKINQLNFKLKKPASQREIQIVLLEQKQQQMAHTQAMLHTNHHYVCNPFSSEKFKLDDHHFKDGRLFFLKKFKVSNNSYDIKIF